MTQTRAVSILAAAVVACVAPDTGEVEITNARAPSPPADVMAVYLTIWNPRAGADTLLTGSAPGFSPFEVHESMSVDGMMTMRPIRPVVIPARSELSLTPGGLHGMLSGFDAKPQAGDTVLLTLTFAIAGSREVPVAIVTYADLER